MNDESALRPEKTSVAPTGQPTAWWERKWRWLLLIPGAVLSVEAVNFVTLLVTFLVATVLPGVPVHGGWGRCAQWALWIVLLRAPLALIWLVLVFGRKVMRLPPGEHPTKALNSRGGRFLNGAVEVAMTMFAAAVVFVTQLTALPQVLGMTAVATVAVFLIWQLFNFGARRQPASSGTSK